MLMDDRFNLSLVSVYRQPLNEFGRYVRVIRTQRRLSQRLVADRMGCDRSVVSNIELGKVPSFITLVKLAQALQMDNEQRNTLLGLAADAVEVTPSGRSQHV